MATTKKFKPTTRHRLPPITVRSQGEVTQYITHMRDALQAAYDSLYQHCGRSPSAYQAAQLAYHRNAITCCNWLIRVNRQRRNHV